ncbi:MAG: cytochrome c oxidase assembly factor Coa1 family protein [Pirellulaceae bacterium]
MSGQPHQFQQTSGGSSKLLWIIPIGCLLVLLVCGGGISLIIFQGVNMVANNPAVNEAVELVENSPEVKELFGEPVTYSGFNLDLQDNELTLNKTVSGSKAKGKFYLEAFHDGNGWKRRVLYVETSDGQRIDF